MSDSIVIKQTRVRPTPAFKRLVVAAYNRPGATLRSVAAEYGVSWVAVHKWWQAEALS